MFNQGSAFYIPSFASNAAAQQAALQEQERMEIASEFCEIQHIDDLCEMMDRDPIATSVFSGLTEGIAAWN